MHRRPKPDRTLGLRASTTRFPEGARTLTQMQSNAAKKRNGEPQIAQSRYDLETLEPKVGTLTICILGALGNGEPPNKEYKVIRIAP